MDFVARPAESTFVIGITRADTMTDKNRGQEQSTEPIKPAVVLGRVKAEPDYSATIWMRTAGRQSDETRRPSGLMIDAGRWFGKAFD
jgi:hypothetical protein